MWEKIRVYLFKIPNKNENKNVNCFLTCFHILNWILINC